MIPKLDGGFGQVWAKEPKEFLFSSCEVHILEVFPLIREVVDKEMTILADSGFIRGSDVLKALAMGADGVLVGQAILLAAIANEETGVRDMIMEMTGQLQRAMTLTGCPDLKSMGGGAYL